jgi:hypothetical protein
MGITTLEPRPQGVYLFQYLFISFHQAAVGKTGHAIGTQAFTPIQNSLGKRWTFIIAAICGIVGILVTFFFVEDLTGEDLAERDKRFRTYLIKHGWEGEIGEHDLKALAGDVLVSGEVDLVEETVVDEKEVGQLHG